MPIRFTCANAACGKALSAADNLAGKQARCPHCGAVMTVAPAAPAAPGGQLAHRGRAEHQSAAPAGPSPFEAEPGAPGRKAPTAPSRAKGALFQPEKTYTSGGPAPSRVLTYVLLALLAAVLIGGLLWVIKGVAEGPLEYQHQVVGAPKYVAQRVLIKTNLAGIDKALKMFAAGNAGAYPPALERLVRDGLMTAEFLKSRTPDVPLAYINGQYDQLPPDNIVVYEEPPGPDGRCHVLRLGGQVEALTPEQLQAALEATRKTLRP